MSLDTFFPEAKNLSDIRELSDIYNQKSFDSDVVTMISNKTKRSNTIESVPELRLVHIVVKITHCHQFYNDTIKFLIPLVIFKTNLSLIYDRVISAL